MSNFNTSVDRDYEFSIVISASAKFDYNLVISSSLANCDHNLLNCNYDLLNRAKHLLNGNDNLLNEL